MKKTVKVYFDFLCPYCYQGIQDLISLLPEYPDIHVDWYPCEAHPRPERMSVYSDIACEAFLYLKGHRGDLIPFIQNVYKAVFEDNLRIDDKELLVKLAENCAIETNRLKSSLIRRDYKQDVMAINSDIWDVYCAEAVPSYYNRNNILESKGGQMIDKSSLKNFLAHLN